MITTNNEALYRNLLRLRSHGINKGNDPYLCPEQAYTDGVLNPWYYEMREMGFNYRITDVQCALGSSQLKKLDRFLLRRRELAGRYDRLLSECAHVEPGQPIGRDRSAHHLYVVRIDFDAAGKSRNSVMRSLLEKQIVCQVHYIPVHYQPFYRRRLGACEDLITTERYYDQALSLPLYYGLSDDEQDFVVDALKAALT